MEDEQADVGDDIEAGEWRVDKEVNYVQLYRTRDAIEAFTPLAPSMAPSPLQVLIGACYGSPEERRAVNTDNSRTPLTDTSVLASLNSSQRHAVELSLAQRLLCIQGPPGTGKTQVADALIRVWSSQRFDGPVVAAAPPTWARTIWPGGYWGQRLCA